MDSIENMGKNDTTRPGFWFKEGSLFDDDLAALRMHETTHTVTLTGLTETETLRPFRLKLNMDLDSFVDPVNEGNVTATLESRLRLSLVSCVLIEHPEEP